MKLGAAIRILFVIAIALVAGAQGCDCGDDWPTFYCPSGRTASHSGNEAICYESDGTPFAARPWVAGDDSMSVCEFCDGFLPPFDAGLGSQQDGGSQ
jgi:hypothetical protein